MRPKQWHMCVQMDEVQMNSTGTSEWTQIKMYSEIPLIWTTRLDKCPNERPYTVNMDVQKTPFEIVSLYAVCH